MSNELFIPNKNIPFFYIIQEISTGRKYAGCRFCDSANPHKFMKKGGYQTSSRIVKSLIKKNGLNSFKILEILTQDEVGDVYEYESNFLIENNVVESIEWLNVTTNTGRVSFGSAKSKEMSRLMFGTDHPVQSIEIREQIKKTSIKKYGVECSLQNEEVKNKSRKTLIEKYGVDNISKNPESQEKKKNTNLEKYGKEFPTQNTNIIEKAQETKLKNILEKHSKDTWVWIFKNDIHRVRCKANELAHFMKYGYKRGMPKHLPIYSLTKLRIEYPEISHEKFELEHKDGRIFIGTRYEIEDFMGNDAFYRLRIGKKTSRGWTLKNILPPSIDNLTTR